LQPISITPVQPQLAESRLPILESAGPAKPSLNEFNSLFARDRLMLLSSGIGGSNSTLGDEVVLSGIKDTFSYSIGQFHYQTDGFRENNDLRQDIYNLFVQGNISSAISLQAEMRHRKVEHGDLQFKFDLDKFNPDFRRNLQTDTIRVGAHYAVNPRSDVILSTIYQEENEDQVISAGFGTKNETQGYVAEAQYLFRGSFFNIVTGGGYYDADNKSNIPELERDISQSNSYLYLYTRYPAQFVWTFGISVDALDDKTLGNINQVNPKLGFLFNLTPDTILRFATFRMLKRPLLTDQTIEPTQVAGFNQLFDDFSATDSWRRGIALDHRFSSDFYAGLEVSKRKISVPIVGITQPNDWQEKLILAYLTWKPYPELVASIGYEFEHFENINSTSPPDTRTNHAVLSLRYFNPSGFFSYFGASYVKQSVTINDNKPTEDKLDDNFVLFDVAGGYRLPNRNGIVQVGIKNIFDQDFQYQDLGGRGEHQEVQQPFSPERAFYAQINLIFD